MEKRDFLTIAELAKILGLSRMGVFKRIKSGKIKANRTGRTFYISRKELPIILGKSIGTKEKEEINRAVDKAVKQYAETFRLLGQE